MGIFGIKSRAERIAEREELEKQRLIQEKMVKDSEDVTKYLDSIEDQLKSYFKKCQIEDDKKILMDIRSIAEELYKFNKEKTLSDDVMQRLEKCRDMVAIMLNMNIKLFGNYNVRESVKHKFEDKEVIKFPTSFESCVELVKELDEQKDKDSSVGFLLKTHFIIDLITHCKTFVKDNDKYDELLKRASKVLMYNLDVFGPISEREDNLMI